MATSTFERKIAITDEESLKKLTEVMEAEAPVQPLSEHPYSQDERERSEDLLRQFLSRSKQ